jgi:hypothetical protein
VKVPAWVVLGIGALAALTMIANAPLRDDLCEQPGARCGSQPGWYTGQESYETLRGVEMSREFDFIYDYSLLWVIVAALLVWAVVRRAWPAFATAALFGLTVWLWPTYSGYFLIVAAVVALLHEHRHRRLRRTNQANG